MHHRTNLSAMELCPCQGATPLGLVLSYMLLDLSDHHYLTGTS
jgi:hypothetical protein